MHGILAMVKNNPLSCILSKKRFYLGFAEKVRVDFLVLKRSHELSNLRTSEYKMRLQPWPSRTATENFY